jgi:drug/metabolite transporter (DMT)-like permease
MRASSIALTSPTLSIPLPLSVAAFCLLWSSAFSVAKFAIADCPPMLLLTARFLLAGVFMLGITAIRGKRWHLSRRDLFVFAVLGIANQAAYLSLSYIGIRTISSGLTALIISANPVLTGVLAACFLGERMTWRKVAGLLLGLGGVAFVVGSRLSGGVEHPIGIAFTTAALVSISGGTILFKKFAPAGKYWVGTGVQNLSAGLALLPIAFSVEKISGIVPSWHLLAAFIYLVLFVSVLAYLLWFHLLTVSGATAASSYHFIMPPLGMLFGWLLLGEHVAISDLVGIVPVAVGIYLVTRPRASPCRRTLNAT